MKTETMGDSRSRFHRSYPNSFRAHLEDIQQHSEACLSAMNILCQSSTQMAEAFTAAFHDTPFAEVSMRMRQVSQDVAARTHSASALVQEDAVAMVTGLLERGTKDKTDESVQVNIFWNFSFSLKSVFHKELFWSLHTLVYNWFFFLN